LISGSELRPWAAPKKGQKEIKIRRDSLSHDAILCTDVLSPKEDFGFKRGLGASFDLSQ
jgi:hypothetical protein